MHQKTNESIYKHFKVAGELLTIFLVSPNREKENRSIPDILNSATFKSLPIIRISKFHEKHVMANAKN